MIDTVSQPQAALDKWGYNTVAKQIFSPIILGVIIFALAGTTDWFWGWVFNIVHVGVWLAMTLVLWRANPEVLNARGKRGQGTKTWDMILLSIYGLDWIAMIVLGALDFRYGWTGEIAPLIYIVGNLFVILGFGLTIWSMAVNRSFEVTVRIQEERDHYVIDDGPYQFVRHPGYTGTILAFYFGMPLALGSWVAFVVGLIGLVTMVYRTAREDTTLQAELPGYSEFTQKTRYRLLPGLW